MYIMADLGNTIEYEMKMTTERTSFLQNNHSFRIHTMHDVAMKCVTKNYRQYVKFQVIFTYVLSNLSVVVANTTNISIFLYRKIGLFDNITIYKLILSIMYIIVINLTAEIEKYKFISSVTSCIMIFIAILLLIDN